jgi:hypothetical protein
MHRKGWGCVRLIRRVQFPCRVSGAGNQRQRQRQRQQALRHFAAFHNFSPLKFNPTESFYWNCQFFNSFSSIHTPGFTKNFILA